MLEELFGLVLVAPFMLLGPLAAEGEPAEFCMPPALMPPMPGSVVPAPAWVEPAWDGLALADEDPMEEGAEPLLDDAMPVPLPPAPIVWAIPAVALSASTAPAIIMVFMEASTFILKHRRAATPFCDAISWLTRHLARKLP
jgi:hypothetical protein